MACFLDLDNCYPSCSPTYLHDLFYVPLPLADGEAFTPYLFLSMVVDPTRTLPIIQFFMQTELFKVAVFPGFTYSTYRCRNDFCRAKISGKNAVKSRSLVCRKNRRNFPVTGRRLKIGVKRNNCTIRSRQADILGSTNSLCRNSGCCYGSYSWWLLVGWWRI